MALFSCHFENRLLCYLIDLANTYGKAVKQGHGKSF
jgi:hypothetical protein